MARFKLHGKTYSTAALDEISLKDLLLFNSQCEDMGLRRNWADVERVARETSAMPKAEADRHPEKFLVISTTIWASRRLAGDDVSLEEAIDVPIKDVEFLLEPQDRQPGKRRGAKKAPAKKATRKASGPAAKRAPAARSSSTSAG